MKSRSTTVNICFATAVLIAGIGVIVLATQRAIGRNTAEAFNRQQLFLVRETARGIEQSVQDITVHLKSAAEMYRSSGRTETLEIMYRHRSSMVRAVFLCGAGGGVPFVYPGGSHDETALAEKVTPVIAAATAAGHDVCISDFMTFGSGSEGVFSFVVAVPVQDGGGQWLCCIPDFAAMKKEYVYPIRTGATGYAWMIDSTGVLLAHPNTAMEGRKALEVLRELWPAYSDYNLEMIINREMTRGEEGSGRYTGWHIGEKKLTKKLIAYSPVRIEQVLWSIGVSAPYREVMAPLMKSIAGPLIFIACFIVVILAGAWLLIVQERKKSGALQELRWGQEVFDGITDGISIIDRDYRVLMVNRAVSQWQGRPQNYFRGRRCHEVFQQQDTLCVGCPARETFETGKPALRERVSTTLAGKKYYFHLAAFPLKDPDGNIVRVAECVRDVTREMELRQELLQHERKSVIVKMSAQVAHEIRNPLGTLTLNIDLLEDEIDGFGITDTAEAKQLISKIKSEIEGLHRVLQEYLECTRFPTIKPEKHDAGAVIEDLLNLMEEDLRRKKIVFTTGFEYDLPAARIDQDQIRRAFINIIQNAVDAMGSGGGAIDVRTRSIDGWLEIVFQDSGPGIPADRIDKIFTPFFTTKSGGTGLGLSITQHIVEEHKGTITCESAEGRYTRFIMKLPVWRDEEQGEV